MFHAVDDIIARHHVKADGRRCGIQRNRFTRAARVTRRIANAHLHRIAIISQCGQIGGRYVDAPGAIRLYLGGIAVAAQRHGNRLPGFCRGRAGDSHTSGCFAAVNNVIACNRINGDAWRGGIHAVLTPCGRTVAVRVGDAHLHAGIAVFQAREIRGRYGGGPVAVCIDGGGIRLAAKGDGNGLVFFHVAGATGEHQIRTFLRRVNHVVGGDGVNADGDRGQIDRDVMADGHRVACCALACNGDGDRTSSQRPDVCSRDRRAPGTICQHGSRISFAIQGHGERCARRQPVAGAGDDQVLTMLDAIDHIVARHGVHTQTRQVGVDGDIAFARTGVAMAVSDGR